MRKIYDCFLFFNEYDILEMRLEETYDYVDYFVIAESNKTHQNKDKPFNLEANWDRYTKYHDKIIYIKIKDMPDGEGNTACWNRENFQRNAVTRGLVDAQPDDIIVVSDCDEMLRGSTYDLMRNDTHHKLWVCRQPIFWGKLNYFQLAPLGYNIKSVAATYEHMVSPQHMRDARHWFLTLPIDFKDDTMMFIHHAGWDFSYLGSTDNARYKLLNFAHDECNHYAETVDLEYSYERNLNPIDPNEPTKFERVVVDDYFPKVITNNLEKYQQHILPNATANLKDYLPTL